MGLVANRTEVKSSFIQEWMKFVPAIIAYGQNSTKKNIKTVLSSLDIMGMYLITTYKHEVIYYIDIILHIIYR